MKLPDGRCSHMGFVRHDGKVYSHVLNLDDDNTYFYNEEENEPEVLMTVTHDGHVHVGDKKYQYCLGTDNDGHWMARRPNEYQLYILGTKRADIYDTEKALFVYLLGTREINEQSHRNANHPGAHQERV